MNIGPIEDRLAIRELIETFAIGAMRKNSEIWGSTWAEDGSWKIDSLDQHAVGKCNVIAVFEKLMLNIEFVSMNSFPAELVIDADKAHGKAYNQELIFPKAGGQKILVGCFHDEYVKRNGRWYFLSRVYETMRRSALVT
jgi:SnoaL-like domain